MHLKTHKIMMAIVVSTVLISGLYPYQSTGYHGSWQRITVDSMQLYRAHLYRDANYTVENNTFVNNTMIIVENTTFLLNATLILINTTMHILNTTITQNIDGCMLAINSTLVINNTSITNISHLITAKNSSIKISNCSFWNANNVINATSTQIIINNISGNNITGLIWSYRSNVNITNTTITNATHHIIYALDSEVTVNSTNISLTKNYKGDILQAWTLYLRAYTQGHEVVRNAVFTVKDRYNSLVAVVLDPDGNGTSAAITSRIYQNDTWHYFGPFNITAKGYSTGNTTLSVNLTSTVDLDFILPTSDITVNIIINGTQYYAEENINITVVVENIGNYTFNGTLEIMTDYVTTYMYSLSINSNTSRIINTNISLSGYGPHVISAIVNQRKTWYEISYQNNNASTIVTIFPKPFLFIQCDKTATDTLEMINITVTIKNDVLERWWKVYIYPGDGNDIQIVLNNSGNITYTYVYSSPGTYEISAIGISNTGIIITSIGNPVIDIYNRAPVIKPHIAIIKNGTVEYMILENNILQIQTLTEIYISFESYDYDGTVVNVSIISPWGQNYTNETQLYISKGGRYTVTLQAMDDYGDTSILEITIEAINRPPKLLGIEVETTNITTIIRIQAVDAEGEDLTYYLDIYGYETFISDNGTFILKDLKEGTYYYIAWVTDIWGDKSQGQNGSFNITASSTNISYTFFIDIDVMVGNLMNITQDYIYIITENNNVTFILSINASEEFLYAIESIEWYINAQIVGKNMFLPVQRQLTENMTLNITIYIDLMDGAHIERNITCYLIYKTKPIKNVTVADTGNKNGTKPTKPMREFGLELILGMIFAVAVGGGVIFALQRRGVIDISNILGRYIFISKGKDIIPESYIKEDFVIIRKGKGKMKKYELYSAIEKGIEDRSTRIYELRILHTEKGDYWDLTKVIQFDTKDNAVEKAMDIIAGDIERGWEIYVQGKGILYSAEIDRFKGGNE